MPLQLPNLDDRRYEDLVAEARRLIPLHDPDWTNHNPSDPGITLVELFAYLTETLLYRLDRVTADNQRRFLKLLNGPDWKPGSDLASDIHDTVLAVRARERAVTAADFERIATSDFNAWLARMKRAQEEADADALDEWWALTQLDRAQAANRPSEVPAVARARCVPSRNLERGTEQDRTLHAPAHVSLIVLPEDAGARQPPPLQRTALWRYLDERRTLTTRHHVVGPYYAPVGAEIVIACATGAVIEEVRNGVLEGVKPRVRQRLEGFLDPLGGGASGSGWPFGRDVYASELYEQIEAVDGVDYIADLMLSSECLPQDEKCAAAPLLWHPEGDVVGLALARHHLPLARLDPAAIVIAPHTSFVALRLAVTLTAPAADEAALKRDAKLAIRKFFHPLHDGPGPAAAGPTDIELADLRNLLEALPGVTAAELDVQAPPARLHTEGATPASLHVDAGELVSWQAAITVEAA